MKHERQLRDIEEGFSLIRGLYPLRLNVGSYNYFTNEEPEVKKSQPLIKFRYDRQKKNQKVVDPLPLCKIIETENVTDNLQENYFF